MPARGREGRTRKGGRKSEERQVRRTSRTVKRERQGRDGGNGEEVGAPVCEGGVDDVILLRVVHRLPLASAPPPTHRHLSFSFCSSASTPPNPPCLFL
eukprot:3424678-Rhodomonas_salina.3